MTIKAYFKPVETIAVAASSTGLSMGEEVEITKQRHKASKVVSTKSKTSLFIFFIR